MTPLFISNSFHTIKMRMFTKYQIKSIHFWLNGKQFCVSISRSANFTDLQILRFVWLCMTWYELVWLCMTMYDYVWLCMTIYDHVWLCMTMHDSVKLYMAIYHKLISIAIATLGPNLQFQIKLKSCLSWACKLGHKVAWLLSSSKRVRTHISSRVRAFTTRAHAS